MTSLYLSHSGCDGKNYSNPCDAHSQGVSISYMGECTEEGDGVAVEDTSSTPTSSLTSVPIPGSSYCTYGPDTACYESGWPSCCDDASTCPEERPSCEIGTVATTSSTPVLLGTSYCTYSPDTACYLSGWPSCCGEGSASCPDEQPPCDYCEVGPSADPSLDCGTAGQFCQLDTGVCNNKAGIHPGSCVETPDMCTMDWNPAW